MATSRTHTNIRVLSREVKLTYLQSVQVSQGQQDMGEIAGEGGGIGSVSSSSSKSGSPGFLGIGASSGSSSTQSANDTGWIISRNWFETHFDKNRYAIGIRDIGIFNYLFAASSAFVSKPFTTPKEIYKVEIKVVEQVPIAYQVDKRYIEYYVTPDDGETWHRINPIDHPSIVDETGQYVPRILTFNPEVGGEAMALEKFVEARGPVFSLRYMVVLRNDPDVADADRHTPVLKSIRMLMHTRGGL